MDSIEKCPLSDTRSESPTFLVIPICNLAAQNAAGRTRSQASVPDSKAGGKALSSRHRRDHAPQVSHLPLTVFREQGGREVLVGA
jgi:hypothetical protein